jgi:hypothetical protein
VGKISGADFSGMSDRSQWHGGLAGLSVGVLAAMALSLDLAKPAGAADLSGCWKMTETDRKSIESIEFGCILDGKRCEALPLTIREAEAKVRENNQWNAANGPNRTRELISGFGVCDGERQIYMQVETGKEAPPKPSPPHWESASKAGHLYVDEQGRRWRFPATVAVYDPELGMTVDYTIDRSRPPETTSKGRLVLTYAYYNGPKKGRWLRAPGTLETARPPAPVPAKPLLRGDRPANDPCRHNPQLYSCLRKPHE